MGNMTVFSGQTVPFLALWDDVIEGSPRPKLNGYQRPIPGGACGAKGLGGFRQTPASEAFFWQPTRNLQGNPKRVKVAGIFQWLGVFYYLFDSAPSFDFLQKSEFLAKACQSSHTTSQRFPRHISALFAPTTVGLVRYRRQDVHPISHP